MRIDVSNSAQLYDFISDANVEIYVISETFIRAAKICPKCGDIVLFGDTGIFSDNFLDECSTNDIFAILEEEGKECMSFDEINQCSCKKQLSDYGDSFDLDDQIDMDEGDEE